MHGGFLLTAPKKQGYLIWKLLITLSFLPIAPKKQGFHAEFSKPPRTNRSNPGRYHSGQLVSQGSRQGERMLDSWSQSQITGGLQ
jgi:hypothetical protein